MSESSSVWFHVIEVNSSFHLFSSNDQCSDIIDLIFNLVFTNTSRVLILCETIAFHWGMKSGWWWTWILCHSFFIILLWIFVAIISLKKWSGIFCNFIFLSHLVSVWSNWIASINNAPWHTNVFSLQIRISVIFQTSFIECIVTCFS